MQKRISNLLGTVRLFLGSLEPRYFAQLFLLFAVYFFTANFGLHVSAVNKFAALIWPPTGIALAALLIFGVRLWPAIFAAAFLVNWTTGAHFWPAAGVATGNTLEALIGLYLCSTLRPGFRRSLESLQDVIRLLIGAAVLSTLASASIGVASLYLGGNLETSKLLTTWLQWWAGDALGDLAVAPLILVFSVRIVAPRLAWNRAHWLERLAFISVLLGLSTMVLSRSMVVSAWIGLKGIYLLIPVLLWGALRFGQRGSMGATFTIATIAIWGTSQGSGPFAGGNPAHLMFFVLTIAMTGLFVGSVATERELERQNLQLREDELKQAKEAAEAANLAKSAFLANMSHEIRTPLGAVLGFSELIIDPEVEEHEKAGFVAAIKRNGELLSNIINDILDLSKVEAGKMEADLRQVSLSEVILDVKTLLGLQAQQKGIAFDVTLQKPLPEFIHTDGLRLRQILLNIVGNAIKFTARGGVTLNITGSSPAQESLGKLAFVISDTGRGIDNDEVAKLFRPFSQVDTSIKREYGGTGLGLVLSKRLARLLGGDVVLTSSVPGKGSVFTVTIDSALPKAPLAQIELS